MPPNSPAMPVPSSHRFCLSAVQARSIRPSTLPSETDKRALVRAMVRSEEHTSELQSLMRISYAVFCLKKKKKLRSNGHYQRTQGTHKNSSNHCENKYKIPN